MRYICRAVSSGLWKLKKHVLLCITIRHLYCNKQLINILNRLGHCETYKFGLWYENAVAKALANASTSLTPQIVTGEDNDAFHCERNNRDKITTNVHGSNMINHTDGIMIQEVKIRYDIEQRRQSRTLPIYQCSKASSFKTNKPEFLPRVHIFKNVGPRFVENTIFKPTESNIEMYLECLQEYRVWMLTREMESREKRQISPGFAGFISCTGVKPKRKSAIDYFTPITNPFTEYSTVKQLLKVSEIATAVVGQDNVLNIFDLGANTNLHIVSPSLFHVWMN